MTVIFEDSAVGRADGLFIRSASYIPTSGNPLVGWLPKTEGGSVGIISGGEYTAINSSGNGCRFEAGTPNGIFTVTAKTPVTWVQFRVTNNSEFLQLRVEATRVRLYRVLTQIGSTYNYGTTISGATTVVVTLSGSSIQVEIIPASGGTQTTTFTTTELQSNTMHGIGVLSTSVKFESLPSTDSITQQTTRYVQHVAGTGTLPLTGAYGGSGVKVQSRITNAVGGATVIDWTDTDTSLSGGSWSGSLSVPKGGPYLVQSRIVDGSDNVLATSDVSASFLVGDVFVAIGQSNVDGRGTNNQTYSGSPIAWVLRDNGVLDETLNDPWSFTSGLPAAAGSFGPLLATLLAARDSTTPQIWIVWALGATSMGGGGWLPTASAEQWNAANALVVSAAPTAIKGVVWMQGETDQTNSTHAAAYQSNEAVLAAYVNAWPGSPPLIAVQLGTNDLEFPNPVRAGKIANWNSGVTKFGGNPITIDLSDAGGDFLHFRTDDELARLAANIYLGVDDAVFSGTNGRGPRLSSAVTIDGSNIVRLTFDRDLRTDSTYTATAFGVSHSGTARTVDSVARTGSRIVELTLSGPLDGTSRTVSMGLGTSAAGATLPRTPLISLPATINSVSSISLDADPIVAYSVSVIDPDTVAPVIASATILSAGTTLRIGFTEVDSPPMLPASGVSGITITASGAAVSVTSSSRLNDTTLDLALSRTIYLPETLTLSYSQSTGNITDSAVPTPNEMADVTDYVVTNNSAQSPSITSVSVATVVFAGSDSTITWSSAGVFGTVDILLSLDNGATFPITLVSGTANAGSYSWTPDLSQLTALGVVRVRSSADHAIYDDQTVIVATTEASGGAAWQILAQCAADAALELTVRT